MSECVFVMSLYGHLNFLHPTISFGKAIYGRLVIMFAMVSVAAAVVLLKELITSIKRITFLLFLSSNPTLLSINEGNAL